MNYAVATSNDMYSLPALMPSTTKVRFTEFPNWLPKSWSRSSTDSMESSTPSFVTVPCIVNATSTITTLIKTIINEHKVVHTGDGNEIREYIHASDVASMAADVIASEEYANQYMILTGVERMKRKELFEMIREILGEDFEVILQNSGYVNHYRITPYSFQPTMSRKMVANTYVDMGQGILECIKQVYKEKENDK